ncbi:MAG: geranylgeranylglycerol-phosphate geranylgeranyltransferase [Cyclobacteriaceae bacterium]
MKFFLRNTAGFILASRVPNLTIAIVVQILTAVFLLEQPIQSAYDLKFILLIISTIAIGAAGYIINDYYDQKIDMINRPSKVVVGVLFQRRLAMLSHLSLNVFAITIGFMLHPFVGSVHVFSVIALWYYSNYLRRLPIIGTLTISFLSSLVVLIVAVFYRELNQLVVIYALFAFLTTLIREMLKDIVDVKGEAAFGCTTVPVVWGIRAAKNLIFVVLLAGVLLLFYYLFAEANHAIKLYFLLVSPAFLWFTYRLQLADTQKQFVWLVNFCSVIIITGILSLLFL